MFANTSKANDLIRLSLTSSKKTEDEKAITLQYTDSVQNRGSAPNMTEIKGQFLSDDLPTGEQRGQRAIQYNSKTQLNLDDIQKENTIRAASKDS